MTPEPESPELSQGAGRTPFAARLSVGRLLRASVAPHGTLWLITAALLAVDPAWIASSSISVEPLGFLFAAAGTLVLLCAGAFWTHVKHEATLRAMANATACLLAFTVAIALLHYLAATLSRPLVDARIATAEAALGFSWLGYLEWLRTWPAIESGLAIAYHSSAAQIGLVVIVLSATLRLQRLAVFIHLFCATLGIVIVISTIFPALGPYAYYGVGEPAAGRLETIGAIWHLEPLARLRDGAVDTIALGEIRGLATFPSFHVCLALITAWALAAIPVVGPLALLLNLAVVIGTVSAGGHYLPDVLAGALMTAGLLGYRSLSGHLRWSRHHTANGAGTATPRSRRIRSAVMRAPS